MRTVPEQVCAYMQTLNFPEIYNETHPEARRKSGAMYETSTIYHNPRTGQRERLTADYICTQFEEERKLENQYLNGRIKYADLHALSIFSVGTTLEERTESYWGEQISEIGAPPSRVYFEGSSRTIYFYLNAALYCAFNPQYQYTIFINIEEFVASQPTNYHAKDPEDRAYNYDYSVHDNRHRRYQNPPPARVRETLYQPSLNDYYRGLYRIKLSNFPNSIITRYQSKSENMLFR